MESPYEHLFVRTMRDCTDDLVNEGAVAGLPRPDNVGDALALMSSDDVPESKIHMTYSWIYPTSDTSQWVSEHEHDYDEVLIFSGNDPDNLADLGAEVYLDIEGVRHTITTSGSVYIPAGTRHCPLGWNHVERPFRFSALSLAPNYSSDENVPRS